MGTVMRVDPKNNFVSAYIFGRHPHHSLNKKQSQSSFPEEETLRLFSQNAC